MLYIRKWTEHCKLAIMGKNNSIYNSIKKNKIIPFVATWMELETLTRSEVSQKEKDKYHMISLIFGI